MIPIPVQNLTELSTEDLDRIEAWINTLIHVYERLLIDEVMNHRVILTDPLENIRLKINTLRDILRDVFSAREARLG